MKRNLKKEMKRARGFMGQRTSIEERPTIPCKKVFLSKKDKEKSRKGRRMAERQAWLDA